MKINLGAGSKRYDGYINVDKERIDNPDFVVDIENENLPFHDSSVDEVLAHHILEHLGDGFFNVMKELYRVCKHGAHIHVRVPHPRHDTFLIDPTHKRSIFPHTLDMFSKKRNTRDRENNGSETPLAFIHDIDISVENYRYHLDPYWKTKFQTMSEDECEHAARSFNNVIAEIEILLKVNKSEQPISNR